MAGAKLERTRHPGIYKRPGVHGTSYVVTFRVDGKSRREHVKTLAEAQKVKAERALADAGGAQDRPLREYAEEWVERHRGNTSRGFREGTRNDYRRDLKKYVYPFFEDVLGARTIGSVTTADVDRWVGWLCDERIQGRRLADASVRRIVSVLSACTTSAKRIGDIPSNPCRDVVLPNRQVADDEDRARVFTPEQLDMVLRVAHRDFRLLFTLLASTGLRWGEVAELRWRDIDLGHHPRIKVRRAIDKTGEVGPPKSRHGRRDVPMAGALATELAEKGGEPEELVFTTTTGTRLNYHNTFTRKLKPVVSEAGAPWAAFHTFRHTFASLCFANGKNIKQVSRMLGHHSAAFTLDTYVHLLEDGVGDPLDLATIIQTTPTGLEATSLIAA